MRIDNTKNTPSFKAAYVIYKKKSGEEILELKCLKILLKKAKHTRIKYYKATDAILVTSYPHTMIMNNRLKEIDQKKISPKRRSKKKANAISDFMEKCSEFNMEKLMESINKVVEKKQ